MPRSEREDLILSVAGQVFADGGYDRASMDTIAAAAGVSKPMLYAYFGSKEGLYVAYVERMGGELVARLLAAGAVDEARLRLRAVISEFLAFVEEQGNGWTILYRELNARRSLADEVARLRAQIVDEVRRMLSGEDGTAGSAGSRTPSALPPLAAEGVAEGIVGAGEALANWWMRQPAVQRDDLVDWYVGMARAAISAATRNGSDDA
jgi:AcrR family transcriptional regulator